MSPRTLSSADVARVAGVQRPVVTMWRKRHRAGTFPFPTPHRLVGGEMRFDRDEVVEWLRVTGRPLSTDDLADVPRLTAYDPVGLGLATRPEDISQATALIVAALTLSARTAQDLGQLGPSALAELLDEIDPDDRILAREVRAAGPMWPAAVAYSEELADACYSASAAIDWLLRQSAGRSAGYPLTTWDDRLTTLVARVANALAAELELDPPVYAEVDRGGSDLARALWAGPEADNVATYLLDGADTLAARLGRARGLADGRLAADLAFDGLEPVLPDHVVVVAAHPSPDEPDLSDLAILQRMEALETALPDSGRAVVVGPASVLCSEPAEPEAARIQDRLLRGGRLRAAIRLPAGLVPQRPHLALGLWVIGRVAEHEAYRHETIAVGALDETMLAAALDNLIDDLSVASAAIDLTPRSLALLRFRRLARIRSGELPLTPHAPTPPVVPSPTVSADEVAHRLDLLSAGVPGVDLRLTPSGRRPAPLAQPLGSLIASRSVRLIPGVSAEVAMEPLGEVAVIRPGRPTDSLAPVDHTSRAAVLATGMNHRLTQPGDVVFTTRGKTKAYIDRDGGSLVLAPARILRIADSATGVLPEAVAQAVESAAAAGQRWRDCPVRLVARDQHDDIVTALAELAAVERRSHEALTAVADLRRDILAGLAIPIENPSPNKENPHDAP